MCELSNINAVAGFTNNPCHQNLRIVSAVIFIILLKQPRAPPCARKLLRVAKHFHSSYSATYSRLDMQNHLDADKSFLPSSATVTTLQLKVATCQTRMVTMTPWCKRDSRRDMVHESETMLRACGLYFGFGVSQFLLSFHTTSNWQPAEH